ncbi:MAG: response regulator transcription factor [Bradyrhizobium sp.]|nr:response regulator [Bradyrhizobium sp.]MDE2375944.1 response regulator transcription factor [Bradyrhizobium sp.]
MPGCVHVVEDDRPMRESLVELLEEAGYTVRAYPKAEDLLARGPGLEPGCIVSDVRMPGMDGLTLLRHLRSAGSALPLILITGHGDVRMAVAAMKAGAADFLEKPFDADTLLDAVETALRPGANGAGAEDGEARHGLQKLTAREIEVFEHVVAGESNKEIAVRLGISPRTVEFHRAHIMEKTNARGLPDLVRLWLSRGA